MLADPKKITQKALRILLNPAPVPNRKFDLAAKVSLTGASAREYELRTRRHATRPMSFSVILSLVAAGKVVNLIRHNGHHGPHPSEIEGIVIPENTCHVHRISERYQDLPHKTPESYAEITAAYTDFRGAVEYMCGRYGLFFPNRPNQFKHPLFD